MNNKQVVDILPLSETLSILESMRTLDLKNVTLDELLEVLRNIGRHIVICTTIPAGRVICRTVNCDYLKNEACPYPTRVEQISFNPNLDSCKFNRASWEKTSVFYGSLTTQLEGRETNSFEVWGDLQSSTKDIDRGEFVIGKWIVKKGLTLVHISGSMKHNKAQVDGRSNGFWESVKHLPEKMLTLKAMDKFLCDQFVADVPDNERWRYKISAAYAQLINSEGLPGLLYPSVKTDGAGYNVALFSDNLYDYIELERAALVYVYKREQSIVDEIVLEALPENNLLKWTEVYKYKLPAIMRNWYTGKSDDKSFDRHIRYKQL